jgi:hypothetical protein
VRKLSGRRCRRPAEDDRAVAVLGLGALQILGPLIGDDLDGDADLGSRLDQFGGAAGVQHVGTRYGHRPDLHAEVADAGIASIFLAASGS